MKKVKVEVFNTPVNLRIKEDSSSILSCRGRVLMLNQVSTDMLLFMNNKKGIEYTVKKLSGIYDCEEGVIKKDLYILLDELSKKYNLLFLERFL